MRLGLFQKLSSIQTRRGFVFARYLSNARTRALLPCFQLLSNFNRSFNMATRDKLRHFGTALVRALQISIFCNLHLEFLCCSSLVFPIPCDAPTFSLHYMMLYVLVLRFDVKDLPNRNESFRASETPHKLLPSSEVTT